MSKDDWDTHVSKLRKLHGLPQVDQNAKSAFEQYSTLSVEQQLELLAAIDAAESEMKNEPQV